LPVAVTPANVSPASKLTNKLINSYQSQLSCYHGVSAGPGGSSSNAQRKPSATQLEPKEASPPPFQHESVNLSADASKSILESSQKDKIIIDKLLSYVFQGKSTDEKQKIMSELIDDQTATPGLKSDASHLEDLIKAQAEKEEPTKVNESNLHDSLYQPEVIDHVN
jgi:hypothetical protein